MYVQIATNYAQFSYTNITNINGDQMTNPKKRVQLQETAIKKVSSIVLFELQCNRSVIKIYKNSLKVNNNLLTCLFLIVLWRKLANHIKPIFLTEILITTIIELCTLLWPINKHKLIYNLFRFKSPRYKFFRQTK